MKDREFHRWIDYHRQAFPGLGAWFGENAGQLPHWEKALNPVPFHVAVCATDALLVEEESKPYSDHCRYVRAYHARQQPTLGDLHCWGPTLKDGELVAHCTRCMDYGIVSVLTPKTLSAAWHRKPKFVVQTCSIACDCERGYEIVRRRQEAKRPLIQWGEGHALIRMDDVIDKAVILLEKGEFDDVFDAYREVASRLLHEYDDQRVPIHQEFAEYAPQEAPDF